MQGYRKTYQPLIQSGIILILVYFSIQFLGNYEYFTEEIYPKFYKVLYPLYTKVFGWISFSVGDFFYLIIILIAVYLLISIIRFMIFGQQWRAVRYMAFFVNILIIMLILFHFLWGFNYQRKDLLQTNPVNNIQIHELKNIAQDLFQKSKKYRALVKENQQGIFLYDKRDFLKEIPQEINPKWDLPFHKIPKHSQKKYSLFSYFMRYFGVSGYYNPFTGEAQITRENPSTSLPFTLAHEQAHQMGYAPEFEANYIGYLTCISSSSPALQYSGNYKALKYVLREIYPHDSIFVKDLMNNYSDGMKRDYQSEIEFYQKYSGKADQAFSYMNDLYLKSNQQSQGIESYNRFVDLLIGLYRKKD